MLDAGSMDVVDRLELSRDILRAKFARLNKGRPYGRKVTDRDKEKEGEHSLCAGKQVKKKCSKCGVWGHKLSQFDDFQSWKCFICHKSRHISRHCPNQKNNKNNKNSIYCTKVKEMKEQMWFWWLLELEILERRRQRIFDLMIQEHHHICLKMKLVYLM